MKKFLTVGLVIITFSSFGQKEIDENGRPIGTKPSFAVSSVEDIYLKKNEASVTGAEVKLDYSLPSGMTSGKITLFHPRRDEELKSYNLNSETGTISISLKDLPISTFSAGLYDSEGKFLKSFNVY
ncbi:hypothetical protein [Jiulongibacter sediminis]|jgi:hypothetical protein|uniref:hypothetical protein n=1 Tax=Jiulongibacter sediminis TaxID=1605367 RepID=UPI0026EF023D|nr:hypothetical protein [Jiulongibacter sediminis]